PGKTAGREPANSGSAAELRLPRFEVGVPLQACLPRFLADGSNTRPGATDAFSAVASAASPEVRSSQDSSRPLRRPFPTTFRPSGESVTTNGLPAMLISRLRALLSFVAT